MTITHPPLPSGFLTFAEVCDLESGVLEGWLTGHAGMHQETPVDSAAAFLFGGLAWRLCSVIGQRWFETGLPPALSSHALVVAQWEHWQEGEEEGDHIVFSFDALWLDDEDPVTLTPERLAADLRTLLAPLVDRLADLGRLPKSAQWRLLGDSITAAVLDAGQSRGQSELAMERANALLAACRSPISNTQVGFLPIDVMASNGTPHTRWFRRRGGCCRYYKVEGGLYCTTCVLRDDESRDVLLKAYVERELAAGRF